MYRVFITGNMHSFLETYKENIFGLDTERLWQIQHGLYGMQ